MKRLKALKILLKVLLALVVLLVVTGIIAYLNAARIAEWAAERALPNARVKVGTLRISRHMVEAEDVIVSGPDGEEVLRVEGLHANFTLAGLRERRIDYLLLSVSVHASQDARNCWNISKLLATGTTGRSTRPLRISELVASATLYVGDNEWTCAFGPVLLFANASDIDTSKSLPINFWGGIYARKLKLTGRKGDWAAQGIHGSVDVNRARSRDDPLPLKIAAVRVGALSIRNISEYLFLRTDGNSFEVVLHGSISGRISSSGVSNVETRDLAVETQGLTLCDWKSTMAVFDATAMIASNRIERVEVESLRLNLWQESNGVLNVQRLLEERTESGKRKGERSIQIGELMIQNGQLAIGGNTVASGLAPITVDMTVTNLDTGNLEAMSGEGTVRLPACDVRLLDRPVTVNGLEAELKVKLGKTAERTEIPRQARDDSARVRGLFSAEGTARVAEVSYKGMKVDSIRAEIQATERSVRSTNITAQFYGSPVTGFGQLHLNSEPVWYNAGLELKQADMEKLSAAIVPDLLTVKGNSYLYLEAVGNLQEPVTWAKLQFKTLSSGTVYVKELPKLLSATSLPADQQQLFLLAFDRGEVLPYKSAWMNADVYARKLTVSTFFERQAKWFVGVEVKPPPFEIPVDVLRERGWLP